MRTHVHPLTVSVERIERNMRTAIYILFMSAVKYSQMRFQKRRTADR